MNEHGHRVFGLWTGTDGLTPPNYLGLSFPSNTSHYIPSQNAVLDSGDIEVAINMIQSKGYGRAANSRLLILANPAEGELIESWRAGEESRTSRPKAKHSFIPSTTAPAYLTSENIVGAVAPGDLNGLAVQGSYGPAWLIESDFIPSGYVAVVATAGVDSPDNVVAVRSHANERYRGLRAIPGNWREYPLIDSFLVHGLGVGVRHRSAAACIQVTASSSYTAPVIPR